MTQDFASKSRSAKPRKGGGNKKRPPQQTPPRSTAPWIWFLAGLLCGVFASGLIWLGAQQPDTAATTASSSANTTVTEPETSGPRFDFYTLLPKQKVEVEVDEQAIQAARSQSSNDQFLLQAGSFKLAEDADRRRGELILLGLEAHVDETNGDNGRWFRVYIGPFESRSRLARARGLTAQQGIDTLLLRRPQQD